MGTFNTDVIKLGGDNVLLNRLKYEAGKIADTAETGASTIAARITLHKRITKAHELATLSALVCGALMQRGKHEEAEKYTQALALIAYNRKEAAQ